MCCTNAEWRRESCLFVNCLLKCSLSCVTSANEQESIRDNISQWSLVWHLPQCSQYPWWDLLCEGQQLLFIIDLLIVLYCLLPEWQKTPMIAITAQCNDNNVLQYVVVSVTNTKIFSFLSQLTDRWYKHTWASPLWPSEQVDFMCCWWFQKHLVMNNDWWLAS